MPYRCDPSERVATCQALHHRFHEGPSSHADHVSDRLAAVVAVRHRPCAGTHPVRDTLKGHSDATQRLPPPEREGRGSRDDGTPAARAHVHPTGTPGAPRAASRAASVSMCATGSRRSCTTSSGSIAPRSRRTIRCRKAQRRWSSTSPTTGKGRGNRHHDHQRHHDRCRAAGKDRPRPVLARRRTRHRHGQWVGGGRSLHAAVHVHGHHRAGRDRPRPNTGSTGTVHNHATSTTHPRLCVPRMPLCDWHVAFHDCRMIRSATTGDDTMQQRIRSLAVLAVCAALALPSVPWAQTPPGIPAGHHHARQGRDAHRHARFQGRRAEQGNARQGLRQPRLHPRLRGVREHLPGREYGRRPQRVCSTSASRTTRSPCSPS